LKNVELLADIEAIARDQQERIDAERPNYEHSSVSAAKRKLPGIFHTLASEARAKILIVKSASNKI
jgi:hypothetical protein